MKVGEVLDFSYERARKVALSLKLLPDGLYDLYDPRTQSQILIDYFKTQTVDVLKDESNKGLNIHSFISQLRSSEFHFKPCYNEKDSISPKDLIRPSVKDYAGRIRFSDRNLFIDNIIRNSSYFRNIYFQSLVYTMCSEETDSGLYDDIRLELDYFDITMSEVFRYILGIEAFAL